VNVQFEKGTVEYLDGCIKAMENSTLCTSYFQSEESRKNAVMEGINRGTLYVVLCSGDCAGFAYFIPEGAFHAYPYLHLIAIKEEYRGKGLGKKLLEFIEDMLFKTRDKLFLLVGDYNPDAKIFYEKLGYTYLGTIPSLYRKGIDEYLMMKESSLLNR
jgi:ribosomal protein S18 acetylase RimI-like enzyme